MMAEIVWSRGSTHNCLELHSSYAEMNSWAARRVQGCAQPRSIPGEPSRSSKPPQEAGGPSAEVAVLAPEGFWRASDGHGAQGDLQGLAEAALCLDPDQVLSFTGFPAAFQAQSPSLGVIDLLLDPGQQLVVEQAPEIPPARRRIG